MYPEHTGTGLLGMAHNGQMTSRSGAPGCFRCVFGIDKENKCSQVCPWMFIINTHVLILVGKCLQDKNIKIKYTKFFIKIIP